MRKAEWAVEGAKVNVSFGGKISVYEIVRVTPTGQIVLDDNTRFYPGELANDGSYHKASRFIGGKSTIMTQRNVPVSELTGDHVGRTVTAVHKNSGDYVTGELKLIRVSTRGDRPGAYLEIDVPGVGVLDRFFRTTDIVVLHGN